MAEHSDENSSKQCAPQLPCHDGYMAIGTGNELCWQPPEDDAHSEVSNWLWGSQRAKYGPKRTQSSSWVSPCKRARLHALSTTVRSGYSSVREKVRDLRD